MTIPAEQIEEMNALDRIVEEVTAGFRANLVEIMRKHPRVRAGDMTSEQQCAIVAEASGWRTRAEKAEARITELEAHIAAKPERMKAAVERCAKVAEAYQSQSCKCSQCGVIRLIAAAIRTQEPGHG